MKTLLTIISLILVSTAIAQDIPEIEIKSDVNEVTVFFESAQITRTKALDIKKGQSLLKFVKLSPYIDARSVKAKVNGEITVLSVNHQQNFVSELSKSSELKALENKLKESQKLIVLEQTYLAIISEEIQFLQANRVISGKAQDVNISLLREASKFYGEKLTALKMDEIKRRSKEQELRETMSKIQNQIAGISSGKEFASGEVLVKIDAKKDTRIELDLSYIVSNAGWYPSYDIRAKNVDEPIQIIYKANVHQDTKSDWKDIKLTFSSNNPDISNIAPELKTYFLNYGTFPPEYASRINKVYGKVYSGNGEVLAGAFISIPGSTIGTITDSNGNYSLTLPQNANALKVSYVGMQTQELGIRDGALNITLYEDFGQLDEVMAYEMESVQASLAGRAPGVQQKKSVSSDQIRVRGAASRSVPLAVSQTQNQTSVEFEIDMPYSIKSDSKNYAVDMAEYEVPAYYQYLCIPRIDKDAFLIANITGWEKYNLMEGEASLYFEGTFVGKSLLDVRFASDTLELSLGRDKSVSVKREKVKDLKSKQFIGTKQEESRAWKIDIRNNKAQNINMLILDQVPVPANEEIELNVQDKSGADYNTSNGEIKWSFTLKPGDKKDLDLKYSIKYPKNRRLIFE